MTVRCVGLCSLACALGFPIFKALAWSRTHRSPSQVEKKLDVRWQGSCLTSFRRLGSLENAFGLRFGLNCESKSALAALGYMPGRQGVSAKSHGRGTRRFGTWALAGLPFAPRGEGRGGMAPARDRKAFRSHVVRAHLSLLSSPPQPLPVAPPALLHPDGQSRLFAQKAHVLQPQLSV